MKRGWDSCTRVAALGILIKSSWHAYTLYTSSNCQMLSYLHRKEICWGCTDIVHTMFVTKARKSRIHNYDLALHIIGIHRHFHATILPQSDLFHNHIVILYLLRLLV